MAIPQIVLLGLGVLSVFVEIRARRGPRPARPEVIAAALDRARRRALEAVEHPPPSGTRRPFE